MSKELKEDMSGERRKARREYIKKQKYEQKGKEEKT